MRSFEYIGVLVRAIPNRHRGSPNFAVAGQQKEVDIWAGCIDKVRRRQP